MDGSTRRCFGIVTCPARSTWRALFLVAALGAFVRADDLSVILSPGISSKPAAIATTGTPAATSVERDAFWIWTTEQEPKTAPVGSCHFRRAFDLKSPGKAILEISADDAFELFVNGDLVGSSEKSQVLHAVDIAGKLVRGRNVVAAKVTNTEGGTFGLAVRLKVQDGDKWYDISTNDTWRCSVRSTTAWNTPFAAERGWSDVRVVGKLIPPKDAQAVAIAANGTPAIADPTRQPPTPINASNPAANEVAGDDTVTIPPEFQLERVLDDPDTGSLIAFTFNEFGQIVASREGAGLLLIYDSDKDGRFDKVRPYCDQLKNCQGLLALNGAVWATGEGPAGVGLYRLADGDRDGQLDQAEQIVKFAGEPGEHGPHGIALGPDGWVYAVHGNQAKCETELAESSPYRFPYEGDLVTRYEDPSGQATGIKAPCGGIVRVKPDGKQVEQFAGGLRNCYDLAFNREGELFTHDSDNEADDGAPWYRPTQVYHVIPGAEFGWRSGWASRPDHFLDSLPAVVETGRGSPTGMVCYNHFAFPVRYHNALFVGDWSNGRILAITCERNGSSYKGTSKVFIEGAGLNVTDIEVAPDGSLYFTTGGRGTAGALHRVSWRGEIPKEVSDLGQGVTAAVRQPQLHATWARQKIAVVQRSLGADWNRLTPGVARSTSNPAHYRERAIDLMRLFGAPPDAALMLRLTQEKAPELRAKAVAALGQDPGEAGLERLLALIDDDSPLVRRTTYEALALHAETVPVEALAKALADKDRFAAWSARKLLERIPTRGWRDELLGSENARVLAQSGLVLVTVESSADNAQDVLEHIRTRLGSFVSDADYLDLMRTAQVALHLGALQPTDAPDFQALVSREYPTRNPQMNGELIRLLAFFKDAASVDNCFETLRSSHATLPEKLHVAAHLRFFDEAFAADQKMEYVKFCEEAIRNPQAAGGYARYMPNVLRDFGRTLTPEEGQEVLRHATEWPNTAMGAIIRLPNQLDANQVAELQTLDRKLESAANDASRRLQIGIAAVMARSGDADSIAYLREVFDRDPERRQVVAIALAQEPDGENWPFLVRSLPVVSGPTAREIMQKLATVARVPEDPEAFRQVILHGLRLREHGAVDALALMEHWSGEQLVTTETKWEEGLTKWQAWFSEKYPKHLEAVLPETTESRWTVEELLPQILGSGAPLGDIQRGSLVFEKAQCAKCHRFGGRGESLGPDLTAVSKRFSTKEILESTLLPSLVISDQFRSKTIVTTDGRTLSGLVGPEVAGHISVLQPTGEKLQLPADTVESQTPSKTSVMPSGLLNELTVADIADLLAYLRSGSAPAVSSRPKTPPK